MKFNACAFVLNFCYFVALQMFSASQAPVCSSKFPNYEANVGQSQ